MKRIFFPAVLIALFSCNVVPNRMFKTPDEYQFAKDTSKTLHGPYIIRSADKLIMHIYSNDGFKLIDITNTNMSQTAYDEGIEYLVEENGEVKMPVIGRVMLRGMSIKDAENFLQVQYAKYYKDPFVLLRVVNRQALVFHSDGGKGTVVMLVNDHTTLFEALALAGGLSDYSRAFKIRIVRGDLKNPLIYTADISSIEGLMNSELNVYPNDIIYVDAGGGFSKRLTQEFLPYLTILTSLLVVLAFFQD
jgi:polysaccharide export outer membrane protein